MDYIKLTESAFDIFYKKYPSYERLPYEIVFAKDMYEICLELTKGENAKDDLKAEKQSISNSQANLVLAGKPGEVSYIVIKDNENVKRAEFACLAVHELVHLHDSYDFAMAFGDSDFHKAFVHEQKLGEHAWSEFHANTISFEVFYNFLIDNNNDYTFDYILKAEIERLPALADGLKRHISTNNNPSLYYILLYLGQFNTLERLSNGAVSFKKDCPLFLFIKFGELIMSLYSLLCRMNDFGSAKDNFAELIELVDLMESTYCQRKSELK